MRINKFYLIATMLLFLASNAQISKGNWMMGGAADISHSKKTDNTGTSERTVFALAPNVGYFFIDKLAVGASGRLTYTTFENDGFSYSIGPYVRYYFLEKEKPLNVFSEISYGFESDNKMEVKTEKFNAKVGAVYFLNSSVGLEVALNYLNQKYSDDTYNSTNNRIFLGVGFQIYLEKE